jgi:hypothetical protein
MFEKITRAAEKTVSNVSVSRRGFLRRLGRTALAVAGVLGGLAAFPKVSPGGTPGTRALYACYYASRYVPCSTSYQCGGCRNKIGSCRLVNQIAVGTC